jgi:hypothetical protein
LAEIELKLAAAQSDLPALKQALDAMGIRGRTTTLFLVSTYYETPNLQLRRHNMTASIVSATSRVAGFTGTGSGLPPSAATSASPRCA